MVYSNDRRPMPSTAAASDFLGLSHENVFWAVTDWGVCVATAYAANEKHKNALLSDNLFWLWVFQVWETNDEILSWSIVRAEGGFHVYNSEKNAYFFVEKENALLFYYGFHTPKKGEDIPRSLYRGTVYRSKIFNSKTFQR